MNKNNKYLMLILVFSLVTILTLGVTYAFFAARILNNENTSTIVTKSGLLSIDYGEESSALELHNIFARSEAWATKIITVTGNNNTNVIMKYDLGLQVETNGFRNSYIKYDLTLIDKDTNEPVENISQSNINGTPIENITQKNINGTGYKRFGIGSFTTATNEIHKYQLKIYFHDNGKDQSDAQEAQFSGKVVITSAGSVDPNAPRAMFLNGGTVNTKMKTLASLANGGETVTGTGTGDRYITAIKESLTEPTDENKEEKNIVSVNNNQYPIPIYMWYEDGTIYWWSEDKKPMLNIDASNMFNRMLILTNIIGLKNFDSSKSINFSYMFNFATALSDISSISNWNTSNVTNMLLIHFHLGMCQM